MDLRVRLARCQENHTDSPRFPHLKGLCLANYSDPTRFRRRVVGNLLRFRGFQCASVNCDPMRKPETPRREFRGGRSPLRDPGKQGTR
jgi:hypothetical protein